MLRYFSRRGGVIAWRQAAAQIVPATLAPRDNHRRYVSRGGVVRSTVGYGVVSGGSINAPRYFHRTQSGQS